MHETIRRLINGEKRVADCYAKAAAFWGKVELDGMKEAAGLMEIFEDRCREFARELKLDPDFGKEVVMVVVAVAETIEKARRDELDGNRRRLKKKLRVLLGAVRKSNCTSEIKSGIRRMVEFYGHEELLD